MTSQVIAVFLITATVLTFYGMWKVFEKAGESGWKALVPIYNLYTLAKVSGSSGWWFITFFLFLSPSLPYWIEPSEFTTQDINHGDNVFRIRDILFHDGWGNEIWLELSFIFSVILMILFWVGFIKVMYDLAYSFNKGMLFSLGLVFLPFIFLPILGLSGNNYRDLEKLRGAGRVNRSINNDIATIGKHIFLVVLVVFLSLDSTGILIDIFSTGDSQITNFVILFGACTLSMLFLRLFQIKGLTHPSHN